MPQNRPIMFYDGGCPVCMRGVSQFRRLDWARRVAWVDLMESPDALRAHGVDFATAMDSLHVVDRNGELVRGAAAFLTIWRELPYYRILATLFRLPGLLPLFEWLYGLHTRDRYQRRCANGTCSTAQRPQN